MEGAAAAYGVYGEDVDVAEVVRTLRDAGFENEDICVVLAPTHPIAEIVRSASVLAHKCEDRTTTAGLIGWLSGLGAVVIPKVSFFIRSRTFFDALVVAKVVPGLSSSPTLMCLGLPDTDAERLEARLAGAGFLVYVISPQSARAKWAVELLRATGAQETAALERVPHVGAVA